MALNKWVNKRAKKSHRTAQARQGRRVNNRKSKAGLGRGSARAVGVGGFSHEAG